MKKTTQKGKRRKKIFTEAHLGSGSKTINSIKCGKLGDDAKINLIHYNL